MVVMSPAGSRRDPYGRSRFSVEIEGMVAGGFSEVRGLEFDLKLDSTSGSRSDSESRHANEADDRARSDTRRTPWWRRIFGGGSANDSDDAAEAPSEPTAASSRIVLRRGVTDDTELWDWLTAWEAGTGETRRIAIFLLDTDGSEVRGWECLGCRPVCWRGPTFAATAAGVAMESYEVAYDRIQPL